MIFFLVRIKSQDSGNKKEGRKVFLSVSGKGWGVKVLVGCIWKLCRKEVSLSRVFITCFIDSFMYMCLWKKCQYFFLRSEHERHSPNCPFVKGEYTNNVPLSVTYATSPALTHSERAEEVAFLSNTNSHQFIASATRHGSIVVWNVSKQLKVKYNANYIIIVMLAVMTVIMIIHSRRLTRWWTGMIFLYLLIPIN